MRVLYVEDDETMAKAVERMLVLEGYGCDWAATGEEAVKLGQANDYDVILLDIGLPDIDGYEVVRRLREADVQKPFLIQSGLVRRDSADDGLGFGVEDYLIKPFNRAELFGSLNKAVLRHAGRHAAATDRRKHRRTDDWKVAQLVYADGEVAACTIFSRSAGGAAIKVAKAERCWTVPFALKTADGEERRCETCWQFGNKVGVKFV